MIQLRITIGLGFLVFAMGCGPGTGNLTGTVSFDGKPVEVGNVMVLGVDGRPHHGKLQEGGTFKVNDVPVGTAMVGVSSPYRDIPPPPAGAEVDPARAVSMPDMSKWFAIPKKYRDPFNSGLRVEVQPGKNTFEIELKGSADGNK